MYTLLQSCWKMLLSETGKSSPFICPEEFIVPAKQPKWEIRDMIETDLGRNRKWREAACAHFVTLKWKHWQKFPRFCFWEHFLLDNSRQTLQLLLLGEFFYCIYDSLPSPTSALCNRDCMVEACWKGRKVHTLSKQSRFNVSDKNHGWPLTTDSGVWVICFSWWPRCLCASSWQFVMLIFPGGLDEVIIFPLRSVWSPDQMGAKL